MKTILIYFRSISLIAVLLVSLQANSQTFNRLVPAVIPPFEFEVLDSTIATDFLLTPIDLARNYNASLLVLDSIGYLKWYFTAQNNFTDFNYHSDHSVFTFAWRNKFFVMDTEFELIDSIQVTNQYENDLHEFHVLPNGNYLLAGISDSIVDLSADTFNGIPGSDTTHIIGFVIQEFDTNKNVVFDWNSNDYINPLESYDSIYGYKIGGFDYCHGNSIEKDSLGDYYVSLRHTNSIYKVDGVSGHVIWKLGGKDSDFSFVNDAGFSGQHDARIISGGRITLFDNGNARQNKYSRIVEYELDTVNWTATRVGEYIYDSTHYSRAMGNYQTLSNGYQVAGYGLVYRPNPNMVMLDESNNPLAKLYFKDSIVSYRAVAKQLPTAIERAEVYCYFNNGTLVLEAEASSTYLWSTGDTSKTITVSAPGNYQVWINSGIGMLGSHVLEVKNPSLFCNKTSLVEHSMNIDVPKIVYYLDLLGRKLETPLPNQPHLVVYSNGIVKKQMKIDF